MSKGESTMADEAAQKGSMEELVGWLRREARLSRESADLLRTEAARGNDSEAWTSSQMMDGEAMAYEQVIKRVMGYSEREFQLHKKKGTL